MTPIHNPAVRIHNPPPPGLSLRNGAGSAWKDKLRYDARHFADIDNFVYAGIGAALDQWRNRPGEWGQGWGAIGERYASHIGQYAIQRSIMFPVQAVDHEDTRYFRSKRTSYKGRLGDAFLHTIWRHSDTGGMMPATQRLSHVCGGRTVFITGRPSSSRDRTRS